MPDRKWIAPEPGLTEEALEDALQEVIAGLCEIKPELVRPDYQIHPAKLPPLTESWASFSIKEAASPGGVAWHDDGTTRLSVHERLLVTVRFYGPGAREKACALRNGLYLEPNRTNLRMSANLGLVEIDGITPAPDFIYGKFIRIFYVNLFFNHGPQIVNGHRDKEEGKAAIDDMEAAEAGYFIEP